MAIINDILIRLRKATEYQDGFQMTMAPELVIAIANEIERLQIELAKFKENKNCNGL